MRIDSRYSDYISAVAAWLNFGKLLLFAFLAPKQSLIAQDKETNR